MDQSIQGTQNQPKYSNMSILSNDDNLAESKNNVILVQPLSTNETINKNFLNNDISIVFKFRMYLILKMYNVSCLYVYCAKNEIIT